MKKSVKFISLILSVVMFASFCLPGFGALAQDSYIKGVDVSQHNGSVDFASLKSDGYDFVMIRLGWLGTSSGEHIDTYFYNNVKSAYEAGLKFGVYLYSYAYNTTEAEAEANFVLSVLATVDSTYLENMVLPVAYDLEDSLIINTGKCTKDEITANALAFSSVISSAGYTPMVYANDNWFKNYIDAQEIYDNGIKIWYAYWTNTESTQLTQISGTSIPCYIWQYQSGSNHDSGLDQNILYINDMALADIKLSYSSVTYDGYEKCPQVSVYLGTTQLTNGTDYSVTYSNNINAGTATVTVTGAGDYSGTTTKTFKIKAISSSKTTVKLSKTTYVYNGNKRKPTVTVTDSSGNVISSDNYTVNYASGRKKVGEYNVTVKFTGNYSGTETLSFKIKPKVTSVKKVTAKSKAFTVKWKKQSTQVSGYQVQYATNKSFTNNKKTVTVKGKNNTSQTIKSLKSKKTYYVRVRTYKTVNGKKYYSSWSTVKKVTTK